MWLENSIPTADQRLGRNVLQMKRSVFLASYHGIEIQTELLEDSFNKRGVAVTKAERRVAICSASTIIKKISTAHNVKVSHGSVIKFKPFFICTATEREKSLCLCKICLNLRYILTALNEAEDGYWGYNCFNRKCTDCWNISSPDLSIEDPNVEVSYFEFSVSEFPYTATRGPDKGQQKMTK